MLEDTTKALLFLLPRFTHENIFPPSVSVYAKMGTTKLVRFVLTFRKNAGSFMDFPIDIYRAYSILYVRIRRCSQPLAFLRLHSK